MPNKMKMVLFTHTVSYFFFIRPADRCLSKKQICPAISFLCPLILCDNAERDYMQRFQSYLSCYRELKLLKVAQLLSSKPEKGFLKKQTSPS